MKQSIISKPLEFTQYYASGAECAFASWKGPNPFLFRIIRPNDSAIFEVWVNDHIVGQFTNPATARREANNYAQTKVKHGWSQKQPLPSLRTPSGLEMKRPRSEGVMLESTFAWAQPSTFLTICIQHKGNREPWEVYCNGVIALSGNQREALEAVDRLVDMSNHPCC